MWVVKPRVTILDTLSLPARMSNLPPPFPEISWGPSQFVHLAFPAVHFLPTSFSLNSGKSSHLGGSFLHYFIDCFALSLYFFI